MIYTVRKEPGDIFDRLLVLFALGTIPGAVQCAVIVIDPPALRSKKPRVCSSIIK